MPRIDTYTARGQTPVYRLPERVPVDPETGLARLGVELTQAGTGLGQLASTLAHLDRIQRKAAGDLDVDRLDSIAGSKRGIAAKDMFVNPDDIENADAYLNNYQIIANSIHKDVLDQTKDPYVKAQLQKRFYRAMETERKTVYAEGIQKKTGQMIGKFDSFTESQENVAASSLDPEELDTARAVWNKQLNNMRPFLNSVEITRRERTFTKNVFEKNADMLADDLETYNVAKDQGQFEGMAEDRQRHWDREVVQRSEQKDARLEKESKRVRDIYANDYASQAERGVLTRGSLQEGLDRGYITDKRADELWATQLAPPSPEADHAVDQIMDRFWSLRNPSPARADQAMEELAKNQEEHGRRNDKRTAAFQTLQRFKQSLEGEDRRQFAEDKEFLHGDFDKLFPTSELESDFDRTLRSNARAVFNKRIHDVRSRGGDVRATGAAMLKTLREQTLELQRENRDPKTTGRVRSSDLWKRMNQ